MVTLRCTERPPMYSWYPPTCIIISLRCTHGILPMYWTPSDVLKTHTGWLFCSQSDLQEQQEGGHPGKSYYATPDWLSTHCGLSQNLSLSWSTKFFIIHLSTNNLHLFQANCAPQCSVLKINACCLTLAISYSILLSQPLFAPSCLKKSTGKASI